uniref:Uncharacterized protein n=1 Tax=Monopterus albus TaxID=43700 RepID=A0A3Q3IA52_MONAL
GHHHEDDGEVVIVADVVTTRLAGVAVKILLLITPHLLAGHQENQKPKDENNCEPDATKCRGVFVHPTEEALEEGPVHVAVSGWTSSKKNKLILQLQSLVQLANALSTR